MLRILGLGLAKLCALSAWAETRFALVIDMNQA